MIQQIENLKVKIGKLMQDHLAKHDFDTVTILSPLLSRLQQLQRRNADLEQEVSEIESTLKTVNGAASTQKVAELVPRLTTAYENMEALEHGLRQTLRIRIDWRANRRNRDSEEIYEHTAASSMAIFINRLIQEMGDEALRKLEQVRINRGPLISKTPHKDFMNHAQGKPYAHKKLPSFDYDVLTHSQTTQKVEDLKRVCRVLGLVPGSVQIEIVNKRYV
jgi:cell division septum initiation protein DivIVA